MFAHFVSRVASPLLAVAPLLLAPLALAQDRILYKFDGACTNEVINHAPLGCGNGTLTVGYGTGFAAGRFAGGLGAGNGPTAARNVVDTGWAPATTAWTGDVTIAFWARQETPFTTTLSYLFGMSSSGFRLFTNGVAGRGLFLRGLTSGSGDLALSDTVVDFQSLANGAWVHVAVSIDDTAHIATCYVNGAAVQTVPGTPDVQIDSPGTRLVGGYGPGSLSSYSLDEVLFSQRLYSAAEIAELASGTRAGYGAYSSGTTTQCNPGLVTLDSTGGRPFFGNLSCALRVTVAAPQLCLLLYGETRGSLGGSLPAVLFGEAQRRRRARRRARTVAGRVADAHANADRAAVDRRRHRGRGDAGDALQHGVRTVGVVAQVAARIELGRGHRRRQQRRHRRQ
ncbi:MAG: LamG domain-containing protein [Planctomycetota bacterium]|jgi:hypothetical protein